MPETKQPKAEVVNQLETQPIVGDGVAVEAAIADRATEVLHTEGVDPAMEVLSEPVALGVYNEDETATVFKEWADTEGEGVLGTLDEETNDHNNGILENVAKSLESNEPSESTDVLPDEKPPEAFSEYIEGDGDIESEFEFSQMRIVPRDGGPRLKNTKYEGETYDDFKQWAKDEKKFHEEWKKRFEADKAKDKAAFNVNESEVTQQNVESSTVSVVDEFAPPSEGAFMRARLASGELTLKAGQKDEKGNVSGLVVVDREGKVVQEVSSQDAHEFNYQKASNEGARKIQEVENPEESFMEARFRSGELSYVPGKRGDENRVISLKIVDNKTGKVLREVSPSEVNDSWTKAQSKFEAAKFAYEQESGDLLAQSEAQPVTVEVSKEKRTENTVESKPKIIEETSEVDTGNTVEQVAEQLEELSQQEQPVTPEQIAELIAQLQEAMLLSQVESGETVGSSEARRSSEFSVFLQILQLIIRMMQGAETQKLSQNEAQPATTGAMQETPSVVNNGGVQEATARKQKIAQSAASIPSVGGTVQRKYGKKDESDELIPHGMGVYEHKKAGEQEGRIISAVEAQREGLLKKSEPSGQEQPETIESESPVVEDALEAYHVGVTGGESETPPAESTIPEIDDALEAFRTASAGGESSTAENSSPVTESKIEVSEDPDDAFQQASVAD